MNIKKYISDENVQARIKESLQGKAQQFVVSLLSLVNSSSELADCEPASLMNAALTAASLDLPINQNLGFAYIIAYKTKSPDGKTYIKKAQFQMGYKGFIQLAQRSGQFKTINVSDVREGEIVGIDRLTGDITFEWAADRDSLPIVGYVGYMELVNGFRKSMYMTATELKTHGNRFSQTAKRGFGLWVDDFDAMASKTVVKMLLSKYAPLTVEMQKAQLADQSVIEGDEFKYPDNQPLLPEDVAADKETAKILKHIENAKTLDELELVAELVDEESGMAFDKKFDELKAAQSPVASPKKS